MTEKMFGLNAIFTAIATPIALLLGGFDVALQLLVALIVVDYASGLFVAIIDKNLSSQISFKGLCKKVMILFLIFIATLTDKAVGTGFLRDIVVFFYIANEAISVFENTAKLGLPYPEKFKDVLIQLKDKSGIVEEGNK